MNFIEVVLISLSMAMDAFAVCLGAGTHKCTYGPRQTFRLAFHFGLFQFIMPVLGWFAGTTIMSYISTYDHWLAFGLLAFVGGHMAWSGLHPKANPSSLDPSKGWSLVLLSIAVSIDALAVGLSMGIIGVTIWVPAVVIGIVTGMVSWLGLRLGNRLGRQFGIQVEIIGGMILIMLGFRILIGHLMG